MSLRPNTDDLRVIGSTIAGLAPVGWSAARLSYRKVGPTATKTLEAQGADGRWTEFRGRIPFDVLDVLDDLRAAMYRPGAGTWFTGTFTVYSDGRIITDFDYDNEPAYDFAPNSWAADAEKFPRAPENTPPWLAAKAEQSEWLGGRWQLEFTNDGQVVDSERATDSTTTEQGHAWSIEVAERLRARGHQVTQQTDDGQDADGNELQYDQLAIDFDTGSMSLSFWRHLIYWSAEAWPDECDRETFTTVARDVLEIVRDVTGWDIGDQPVPYDRKLLGLGA